MTPAVDSTPLEAAIPSLVRAGKQLRRIKGKQAPDALGIIGLVDAARVYAEKIRAR